MVQLIAVEDYKINISKIYNKVGDLSLFSFFEPLCGVSSRISMVECQMSNGTRGEKFDRKIRA